MNPRNSEPTTESPTDEDHEDQDEEIPPWPERGPEPIALPGPDPAPQAEDIDDVDEDIDDADQLELAVHEEAEAEVVPTDDVDVDLGIEPVGRPLLPDAGVWEERWTAVQAAFVDDPGQSIHQADRLVTEAMEEAARLLLARREALQDRWRTGDTPLDTEQLRITIQGYRTLLFGLLSA